MLPRSKLNLHTRLEASKPADIFVATVKDISNSGSNRSLMEAIEQEIVYANWPVAQAMDAALNFAVGFDKLATDALEDAGLSTSAAVRAVRRLRIEIEDNPRFWSLQYR